MDDLLQQFFDDDEVVFFDRSENSITYAYRRIVRIVRIHFFMKTRYAMYSYTIFKFRYTKLKTT